MSLHALQCALADLFTNAGARDRYESERAAFCDGYDLTEREREQLAALAASAIASYAATLVRKRRAEALRLLPQTREALGNAFAQCFDAWAARTPLGSGTDRYARDCAAFCDRLLRDREQRKHARALKSDRSALRLSAG